MRFLFQLDEPLEVDPDEENAGRTFEFCRHMMPPDDLQDVY